MQTSALPDNYLFNLETSTWTKLPDRKTGVKQHSSCYIGSDLYLVGGMNKDDELVNNIELLRNACAAS